MSDEQPKFKQRGLWQFFDNVQNPTEGKKRKKVETDRAYDKSKRIRKFQASWLNAYTWLYYGPVETNAILKGSNSDRTTDTVAVRKYCVMICKPCFEQYGLTGNDRRHKLSFVEGCTNYQHHVLKEHEATDLHVKAVSIKLVRDNQQCTTDELQNIESTNTVSEFPAQRALTMLVEKSDDRIEKLFRTAHAIAKNGRPFTDMKWQCQLDICKGVDIGLTYHNDKSCKTFIHYIAENE